MTEYFEPILSPHLSGFRKNHSCQSVLVKFVEDCRLNMDNNKVGGAMLTDLSRAFDCLPHRLLTAKLNAYGMSNDACALVLNYFYAPGDDSPHGGILLLLCPYVCMYVCMSEFG